MVFHHKKNVKRIFYPIKKFLVILSIYLINIRKSNMSDYVTTAELKKEFEVLKDEMDAKIEGLKKAILGQMQMLPPSSSSRSNKPIAKRIKIKKPNFPSALA